MTATKLVELLQANWENNKAFVVYRKPHESALNWLSQSDDHVNYVSDFTESGFIFAPFDRESKAVLLAGTPQKTDAVDFEKNGIKEYTEVLLSQEQKQKHLDLVAKAVKTIQETSLQKVVLSRKQHADASHTVPLDVFKRLLANYPTAFVYLWHHPQVGTWLGATPETLLKLEGTRFETMALAGTQKYSGNMEVTWGQKEQEEQELVTQELVYKLKDFDLRKLTVHDRQTHKAGSLLHLKTLINGSFEPGKLNLDALLRALHPTPAVCGLPRTEAEDFIRSQENYDRGYYTGFLGELNILEDKSKKRNRRNVENLAYKTLTPVTRLYVNLRCMQYTGANSAIYVGGGITKDSIPLEEWQETVNKAQTIASIL